MPRRNLNGRFLIFYLVSLLFLIGALRLYSRGNSQAGELFPFAAFWGKPYLFGRFRPFSDHTIRVWEPILFVIKVSDVTPNIKERRKKQRKRG